MSRFNRSHLLLSIALSFLTGTVQAVPSIADSEWDLTGSFKGKISAKCQKGGSRSAPIKSPAKLTASIVFDDGELLDDNQGTFTIDDSFFSLAKVTTGKWSQTGGKIKLQFDNPNASPMAAFATTMAQAFGASGINFSQDGVSGSTSTFQVIKPTITGTINKTGTKLTINESMGFKFNASASALGSSNTCTFTFSSMGRSYTGRPAIK